MRSRAPYVVVGAVVLVGALAVAAELTESPAAARLPGIHLIKHVVVIMQENRSFDSYFGTYPGADGIPTANGVPTVCLPTLDGRCVRPYHNRYDMNAGGPHSARDADVDVAGGRRDGFVRQQQRGPRHCLQAFNPACTEGGRSVADAVGYHDGRDIPNYWAYARDFVLQDHMFEPNASWSLPAHLFLVSEWSARCS